MFGKKSKTESMSVKRKRKLGYPYAKEPTYILDDGDEDYVIAELRSGYPYKPFDRNPPESVYNAPVWTDIGLYPIDGYEGFDEDWLYDEYPSLRYMKCDRRDAEHWAEYHFTVKVSANGIKLASGVGQYNGYICTNSTSKEDAIEYLTSFCEYVSHGMKYGAIHLTLNGKDCGIFMTADSIADRILMQYGEKRQRPYEKRGEIYFYDMGYTPIVVVYNEYDGDARHYAELVDHILEMKRKD